MATPHATGAAALVASAEPALLNNPVGLKNRIMNGKPLLAAAGKTVSGDMVDALKALKLPADSTPPTVSSVTPTGGTTDVATNTDVVASFSEAMEAASVTDPANFTLRNMACATMVPATLSYESANTKAILDPSEPLDASSTYRATVSGAWDLAGNQLDEDPNTSGDQPKTWSFTTAAPPPGTSSPTPNVWAWGSNGAGQLGDCTTTNRTTPAQVGDLSGVTDVSSGCYHSLALKDDGTVWAWGDNYYGQLGDGTTTDRYTPVQVGGLTGVVDVAGGCYHSLAVKDDGTVWIWGANYWGQLGNGTWERDVAHPTPAQVGGLTGVVDVAGGFHHSLALKDDGTAWAWGDNEYGQLGDGTTTIIRTTPVKVSRLSSVKSLSGGGLHSLALKDDGTVWAWGANYYGQLGNGTRDYDAHPTPAQVILEGGTGGLSGVKDVAAGGLHTLALMDDGTVLAWGYNGHGELGIGYTSSGDSTYPVQVRANLSWPPKFLSGIVGVSGGTYHSLALKDDGTVWMWGYNGSTNENITQPVQVSDLSGITYVVAGDSHNLAVSSAIPPPKITSPPNNSYDADGSFSVSGTAPAGSTVELFEGTTSKGTTKADPSSGVWSIDLTGVSEGAHTYKAKATDAEGNTPPASNSVTVTVDKTAPTGTVSINFDARRTDTRSVTLLLGAIDPTPESAVNQMGIEMRISNTQSGLSSASWEDYSTPKAWTLSSGTGTKTVYVQYRDRVDNRSAVVTDTIRYSP
jgi:alpha-tubulin suppressor-like RCC1 family protein